MKTQPGKVRSELGEEARDRVERALALVDAATRKAAQEPDRVRMAWVVKHLVRLTFLHQAPRIEDADAVAHPPNHGQVVADEEDARPELLAQRGDEVENLGLNGRVEAGRGLVEDKQRRVWGERHGDESALLHAARELMRVATHDTRRVRDLHPARACRAPARAASPAGAPATSNASATWSPTRSDGFRAAPGFW